MGKASRFVQICGLQQLMTLSLIDRWFAIWQAAHPGKWYDGQFRDKRNKGKTTDIPPLATENAVPFLHPDGKFWNGNRSQDTETFGYVYTDAVKESAQKVVDDFVDLYSWAARHDPQGEKVSPPEKLAPLPVKEAQVFQYPTAHAVTNFASMVADKAPQVAFGAVKTTAAVVTEAAGLAAPVVEPTESAPPIDTSPVAPGTNTSGVSFTNMEPTDVQDSPEAIDESKYHRDWFVDNVVKR